MPGTPSTIIAGYQQIYKSTNRGNSWDSLTAFTPGVRIDHLTISESNTDYIYASDGATLIRTTDAGVSWDTISTGLPLRFISDILVHPEDEDDVFVSMSTYTSGFQVYRSQDGGSNWTAIAHNLPALPANTLALDTSLTEPLLYVGMDVGVYAHNLGSSTWDRCDQGLPNVIISDLVINYTARELRAGTYGRGVWKMELIGTSGCGIVTANVSTSCNDQGTDDPYDDITTITISPSGFGLSTAYSVSGDLNSSSVAYGTSQSYAVATVSAPYTYRITDDADVTCWLDVATTTEDQCYSGVVCGEPTIIEENGTYLTAALDLGGGASQSDAIDAAWYLFIAPADGLMTISSCGYGIDTRMRVWSDDCSTGAILASSDDNCLLSGPGSLGYASIVSDLVVTEGERYYIEWDDKWSNSAITWDFDFRPYCYHYAQIDGNPIGMSEIRGQEINILGTIGDSLNVFSSQTTDLSIGAEAELGDVLQIAIENCDLTPVPGRAHMYCSDGVLIADAGTITITIEIASPNSLTLTDLDVLIDIDHQDPGQLTVTLISPASTSITLWDQDCAGQAGIKFIANDEGLESAQCKHLVGGTLHVDVATTLGVSVLSLVDGETMTGTWILEVEDHTVGQTGRINTFCLIAE